MKLIELTLKGMKKGSAEKANSHSSRKAKRAESKSWPVASMVWVPEKQTKKLNNIKTITQV